MLAIVFWDIENLNVPNKDKDGSETPQNVIRRIKLLAQHGLQTPTLSSQAELVDLIAVANILPIPDKIRRILSNSNVKLMDCASEKESASDLSLVVEIMKFVYWHKPPARIVIVSNDSDFHKVVAFLDFVGYEVISVVREKTAEYFKSVGIVAGAVLSWEEVVHGKHESGRIHESSTVTATGTPKPHINSALVSSVTVAEPVSTPLSQPSNSTSTPPRLSSPPKHTANATTPVKSTSTTKKIKAPVVSLKPDEDVFADLTSVVSQGMINTKQIELCLLNCWEQYGFSCLKDYIDAAVENGVIAREGEDCLSLPAHTQNVNKKETNNSSSVTSPKVPIPNAVDAMVRSTMASKEMIV